MLKPETESTAAPFTKQHAHTHSTTTSITVLLRSTAFKPAICDCQKTDMRR